MPMLVWLENNNIQRLEEMCCMRRETEQCDEVLLTVSKKHIYAMRSVAIKK